MNSIVLPIVVTCCFITLAESAPANRTEETINTGFTEGFATDQWYVYFDGRRIDGANRKSFRLIGDGYAKDQSYIYFRDKRVKNAAVRSFKVLGDGYGKDSWYVFFAGEKIDSAHVQSFNLISFDGNKNN